MYLVYRKFKGHSIPSKRYACTALTCEHLVHYSPVHLQWWHRMRFLQTSDCTQNCILKPEGNYVITTVQENYGKRAVSERPQIWSTGYISTIPWKLKLLHSLSHFPSSGYRVNLPEIWSVGYSPHHWIVLDDHHGLMAPACVTMYLEEFVRTPNLELKNTENRRKPSAFGVYSSPSRWRMPSAFMSEKLNIKFNVYATVRSWRQKYGSSRYLCKFTCPSQAAQYTL